MLLDQITGRLVSDGSRRSIDYTQGSERAASDGRTWTKVGDFALGAAIKPFAKIVKLIFNDLCGWG